MILVEERLAEAEELPHRRGSGERRKDMWGNYHGFFDDDVILLACAIAPSTKTLPTMLYLLAGPTPSLERTLLSVPVRRGPPSTCRKQQQHYCLVRSTANFAAKAAARGGTKPKSRHYVLRYLGGTGAASSICFCPTTPQKADGLTKIYCSVKQRRLFLRPASRRRSYV